MTLVSVILPTYNGQRYLKQSIESVLNQTHKDIELIIVNDCSIDDTRSIAEEFVKKDSRVKLINNDSNAKLPKSLNIGFEKAQGQYYTWTSDDNYFHPTAIEKMLQHLEENPDNVLVCCDFEIVNEDDTPREIRNLNISPVQMMVGNPCGACFMYRESAAKQVGEYNVNKFLVEDYDYWIRMGLVGKIGHIAEILYTYRFHPKSLTATRMNDILKSTSKEIREFLPLYLEKYSEIKNSKEIKELENKLRLEDVLEKGDKNAFKILKKIYKPSKFYKILKSEYKNTGQKFLLKFISKLGVLYKIKAMILNKKSKVDIKKLERFNMVIAWIKKYSIKNSGIAIDSSQANTIYPEVTGYYIPTLIKWGDKKRAKAYADYLLSIQNTDGSWNDPSGTTPYTFDTGQILKGLYEFIDEDDKYKQSFLKGCDWIVSQQRPDGSISTPDTSYWGLPDGKFVPEAIHLYCLEPLSEAGKKFGIQKYEICVQKALDFYLSQKDVTAFETLSHFNAYVIEALIDLGETDRAKKAMDNISTYQRENGSVPAYAHVDFVCSTGLFQYAICWYKLGDVEKGDKAFNYALELQNKTGGWYGSYGKGANYFPKAEIAWAVKYFLDALYYKTRLEFENMYQIFPTDIDSNDGRYLEVKALAESANTILDLGCGKGRFDKNLIAEFPDKNYYGVDISQNILNLTPPQMKTAQGSLLNIPFENEKFDFVFCVEALEHAINIKAAIKEMSRVLKKGGQLLIIDKNIKALGRLEIEEWEQWFDVHNLQSIMQEYGLKTTFKNNIAYEKENLQDGLFTAWYGTKNIY